MLLRPVLSRLSKHMVLRWSCPQGIPKRRVRRSNLRAKKGRVRRRVIQELIRVLVEMHR